MLPPPCQHLLAMLSDTQIPYAEISATLGIAAGSIGLLRGRCLEKLRSSPSLAALVNAKPRAT